MLIMVRTCQRTNVTFVDCLEKIIKKVYFSLDLKRLLAPLIMTVCPVNARLLHNLYHTANPKLLNFNTFYWQFERY